MNVKNVVAGSPPVGVFPRTTSDLPVRTSCSIRNVLGIPSRQLDEFCSEHFGNILTLCASDRQASAIMAGHLENLLEQVREVTPDQCDKHKIVSSLTNNLLASLTHTDLEQAQRAIEKIQSHFDQSALDGALNALRLSYHKATHSSGRMAHAQEMQSDVLHFFQGHSFERLAGFLAYFHDHVQILQEDGTGIGNQLHWGLNEIATAAALGTLAGEARVDVTGQESLCRVAAAVIPSGTAFDFMPNIGRDGKPGLGTVIEGLLRSGALSIPDNAACEDMVAMAYTLAICDTQRNNLSGLARPTNKIVYTVAPAVYRLLMECAQEDPLKFGTLFFDNGRLSEAGLALCSKLTTTVEVFEEFAPYTDATAKNEKGGPNNPLSVIYTEGTLTAHEKQRAVLELLGGNGFFGSANVAEDIEGFSKTFHHSVLEKIRGRSIMPDPRGSYIYGYAKLSEKLGAECHAGRVNLDAVLGEIKAMGGSVLDREKNH
ncbi:hypothetical protein [Pseudomonas sp. R3-52-08]|uniref:hypothetical protein n=1 Tax=Pseudomonas sp. R3-52-08 TaxID=1173284 RepID=UPI000F5775D2|nr:hypothetical protein [Pseudomonas sp. R3-52-08]AZF20910.1 hypothetical protein C4J91_2160 [Pseudomonas sp. R3-52-08]